MSAPYEVLARKYRPRTLADLVGQPEVAASLRNALREGRIAHAYLFAGPRGVGKTSTARILARALNCAKGKGPVPDPCGSCAPCREIEADGDADVVEMDAASHRGIDDARALRDAVSFRPLRDRFRVYIVDECHMLTAEAWNALLKTLEEPPGHVRFVFATTALERVPETIRSRCQVFEFRRIGDAEIVERLRQIAAREGFEADDALLAAIAGGSRGGMRDAQTLLDQLVAFAGKHPGVEDLARLVGASDRASLVALFDAIAAGDRAAVLKGIDGLFERGADEETLLDQAVEHLRALLALRVCGKDASWIRDRETPASLDALERQAAAFAPDRIEEMAQSLLLARLRLRDAPALRRAVVELALVRLSRGEEYLSVPELVAKLEALERSLGGRVAAGAPVAPARPRAAPGPTATAGAAPPRNPASPPPAPAPGGRDLWTRVVEAVRRKSPFAADALARARPASLEGPRVLVPVARLKEAERRTLADERIRATVDAELRAALGADARIEFSAGEGAAGGAARAGGPSVQDAAAEVARQFDGEVLEEGR